MKRPSITKKLSLISFCLSGIGILIQACMPAFEKIVTYYDYVELTTPVIIALEISVFKMLPFVGVCFWNWKQDIMTQTKAIVTVILAPALYVFWSILVGWLINIFVALMFGTSVMAAYSVFSNTQGIFSLLLLAGLVLICCACAIDLYALKYHTVSQNQ